MSNTPSTKPSSATRAEEARDAAVEAGADEIEGPEPRDLDDVADEEVAEHYKEMIDRGVAQEGEGRIS